MPRAPASGTSVLGTRLGPSGDKSRTKDPAPLSFAQYRMSGGQSDGLAEAFESFVLGTDLVREMSDAGRDLGPVARLGDALVEPGEHPCVRAAQVPTCTLRSMAMISAITLQITPAVA